MANTTPLTAARLKEVLHYDPETGIFTWVKPAARVRPGARAGSTDKAGYHYIKVFQQKYAAHRLAFLYMTGEWPSAPMVDHVNGRRDDNRWANLRAATASENNQNKKRPGRSNTSGYLGACWDKTYERWIATITLNGKSKTLGRYSTREEAHAAYLRAKRELHPFNTL